MAKLQLNVNAQRQSNFLSRFFENTDQEIGKNINCMNKKYLGCFVKEMYLKFH